MDTPIYEGDIVEVQDPRGGTLERYVTAIEIADASGAAGFDGMSHITAVWGTRPTPASPAATASSNVYNAPVINIQGNRAQVAWGNHTLSQSSGSVSAVTLGYEEIASVVATALQNLQPANIDQDEKDLAVESAETVLREVTADMPNSRVVRRGLATLKGVLGGLGARSTVYRAIKCSGEAG